MPLVTDLRTIFVAMKDQRWKSWYSSKIGRHASQSEAFYIYALQVSGFVGYKREYVANDAPPVDIAFPEHRVAIEVDTNTPRGYKYVSGKKIRGARERKIALLKSYGWTLIAVRYVTNYLEGNVRELNILYSELGKCGVHPQI
jgi:hypothetical protein